MGHDVIDLEDQSEVIISCLTESPDDLRLFQRLGEENAQFLFSISRYEDHSNVVHEKPDVVVFRARIVDAFEDFELIKSLREKLDYVPILAMMDHQDPDLVTEYLRSGVSAFLLQTHHSDPMKLQLAALNHLTKMSRVLELENRLLKNKNKEMKMA